MDLFNRPPAISEDTLHYVLHPTDNLSDRTSATTLATVILSYVDSLLPDHLWHKDAFQLKVVVQEGGRGYVLEGTVRVGDCVDDEWCAVWLLKEISSKWDVAISINDTDGEFLLIEAAEHLPSWVTPSNAYNRVWIYNSRLHLIPLSHVSAPSSKPPRSYQYQGAVGSDDEDGLHQPDDGEFLFVHDALKVLRDPTIDTRAPQDVENAVEKRIYGYPAAASQHVHYTKVYIPVDIAKALSANPSLVQKPVETFYTRDAIQLRAAHRMTRFPPEPSVLTTIKMTRTAYAQLLGQKFFPPKIFGHWQEMEGTPERRWREVGMKVACGFEMLYQESKGKGVALNLTVDGISAAADARRESLQRNADYQKYIENLKGTAYFRGEVEGSALWKELEDKAGQAFVAARRDDDASRPSFALEVNLAISQAEEDAMVSTRAEDSNSWLDIDATTFDTMLEQTLKVKQQPPSEAMPVDPPDDNTEGDVTRQQTTRLQEMAKKVEAFVEGKGDLEGARFDDDRFSDEWSSGEETEPEDVEDEDDVKHDRRAAMEELVSAIDPSEYGKMPPSFYNNSQRVARETRQADVGNANGDVANSVQSSSASSTLPTRSIRPPIIPRDQYDGVDSDDETDEEDERSEDVESEEEMPQVVGEVEIDMEQEKDEFVEFARQVLGVTDEQWVEIIQDRKGRGAFVPDTAAEVHAKAISSLTPGPSQTSTESRANPSLNSFEAVMAAMDAELGRLGSLHPQVPPPASDKGKSIAVNVDDKPAVDIDAAMDTELRNLLQGEPEDGEDDDMESVDHLDYTLIKNFLESFKSQNGSAGPVGNLVGRLQPGWTLPRDDQV